MKTETSYLHHLRFDSRLKNSFVAKYLSNPRLVILLLLTIIGIGATSYASLPRRVNPEINIPIIVVSTVLPGANPQDVESLVSQPIEDGIDSVANIKTVSSTSQENVSIVQIEFNSGIDPDKARGDIQSAIDQVELPTDALSPKVIKIDFENQPVWTFTLIGKGDVASLSRFAIKLKNDLENKSSIDNATTNGLEEREISVIIDPSRIATYGITPFQLSSLVKASVGSFPAGTVLTQNSSFALSIDPAVTSVEDVRNLQLNIQGTIVPLSSIATITERSKPNQSPSYFASHTREPERSITFNVYKTSTANIDQATKDAEKIVHENIASYKGQFETLTIVNSGELINEQFNELIRDFSITTILVFIVLFVFLGARQAFVSFFAVPLTFLISFSVMKFTGISLNFLSMFSLLLSLGLLVDDTIVVISAMTSYYRSKKFTPLETGLLVWKDFLTPILTTTLTTVWAFLPLLLSTGIIGEFIKAIPIVVSSTLLASLAVALLVTLPLMIILLKPAIPSRVVVLFRILFVMFLLSIFAFIVPKGIFLPFAFLALFVFLFVTAKARLGLVRKSKIFIEKTKRNHQSLKVAPSFIDNGVFDFGRFSIKYRRALAKILATKENRRRAVFMVITFSLFSYLLVPFGFVKSEFFPKSDQDFVYVSVELPAGTNTDTAEKESLYLLKTLRNTKDVSYVIVDIGQAFSQSGGQASSGSNNILYSLVLPKNRSSSSIDIAQNLRDTLSGYTPGKLTVTEESGGPPAGADVQIKLFGDDIPTIDSYANNVVSYLEKQKGTTDISKSIKPGTSKIVFVPNQTKLLQNNLTQDQVGIWLRSFASGFTLDSVKFGNEAVPGNKKQDITFRMSPKLESVSDISTLSIPTQSGPVAISSLGKLKLESNPTLITREDGKRTISITATVTKGYQASEINKNLESYADNNLNLPDGYSWKTGGANEENQNSVTSILAAMLLSFLLIVVTMVIQFGSFRKAIIVMLVIPLSISGVFIVFALTKTPLSFPALIGILALFGIVVKNAILVVDKINANVAIGMKFADSIVDASESRLEPIALTSLATICGLIPITVSDPLWRGLGGAIIAGLLFSGTIMLFFIPVVYYNWFNPVKKTRIKRS
ncbi:MAG: efflux RND transporter permease subunit [Candidatus Levybacteria bacterium]|nr:efflux RND transporter permease subunit [Candidatus Levybacteria bacterium]